MLHLQADCAQSQLYKPVRQLQHLRTLPATLIPHRRPDPLNLNQSSKKPMQQNCRFHYQHEAAHQLAGSASAPQPRRELSLPLVVV
jgi:hypothetical protein